MTIEPKFKTDEETSAYHAGYAYAYDVHHGYRVPMSVEEMREIDDAEWWAGYLYFFWE